MPIGALDSLATVNRDTFPSGHTELTLTAIYLAFTLKAKIRWGLFVVGTLLIISTVYMRYHYVVDVMAGMLMFVFAVWSGKRSTVGGMMQLRMFNENILPENRNFSIFVCSISHPDNIGWFFVL